MGFLGALADVAGGVNEGLLPGFEAGRGLRRDRLDEEERRRRMALEEEERIRLRQDRQLDDESQGIVRGNTPAREFRQPRSPVPTSLFEGTPLEPGADNFADRVRGQLFGDTDLRDPAFDDRMSGFMEEVDPETQFGGPFAFFDPERKAAFDARMRSADPLAQAEHNRLLRESDPDLLDQKRREMVEAYPERRGSIMSARTLTELNDIIAGEEPDAEGRAGIDRTNAQAGQARRSPRPLSPAAGQSSVNSRIRARQAIQTSVQKSVEEAMDVAYLYPNKPDYAQKLQKLWNQAAIDNGFESLEAYQAFTQATVAMMDGDVTDGRGDGGGPANEFDRILEEQLGALGSVEAVLELLEREGLDEQEVDYAERYLADKASGAPR